MVLAGDISVWYEETTVAIPDIKVTAAPTRLWATAPLRLDTPRGVAAAQGRGPRVINADVRTDGGGRWGTWLLVSLPPSAGLPPQDASSPNRAGGVLGAAVRDQVQINHRRELNREAWQTPLTFSTSLRYCHPWPGPSLTPAPRRGLRLGVQPPGSRVLAWSLQGRCPTDHSARSPFTGSVCKGGPQPGRSWHLGPGTSLSWGHPVPAASWPPPPAGSGAPPPPSPAEKQ